MTNSLPPQVEAIIDQSEAGDQYLVKWAGYPSSENTWEPIAEVKHLDAFKAYKDALQPATTKHLQI